jgi:hypothetical protein
MKETVEQSRAFVAFHWMIKKQCVGLPWSRQTRLRVTEHLIGLDINSITTSKAIGDDKFTEVLEQLYPDYETEYSEPPLLTQRQIRILCEHYSKVKVDECGLPPTPVQAVRA